MRLVDAVKHRYPLLSLISSKYWCKKIQNFPSPHQAKWSTESTITTFNPPISLFRLGGSILCPKWQEKSPWGSKIQHSWKQNSNKITRVGAYNTCYLPKPIQIIQTIVLIYLSLAHQMWWNIRQLGEEFNFHSSSWSGKPFETESLAWVASRAACGTPLGVVQDLRFIRSLTKPYPLDQIKTSEKLGFNKSYVKTFGLCSGILPSLLDNN